MMRRESRERGERERERDERKRETRERVLSGCTTQIKRYEIKTNNYW